MPSNDVKRAHVISLDNLCVALVKVINNTRIAGHGVIANNKAVSKLLRCRNFPFDLSMKDASDNCNEPEDPISGRNANINWLEFIPTKDYFLQFLSSKKGKIHSVRNFPGEVSLREISIKTQGDNQDKADQGDDDSKGGVKDKN